MCVRWWYQKKSSLSWSSFSSARSRTRARQHISNDTLARASPSPSSSLHGPSSSSSAKVSSSVTEESECCVSSREPGGGRGIRRRDRVDSGRGLQRQKEEIRESEGDWVDTTGLHSGVCV